MCWTMEYEHGQVVLRGSVEGVWIPVLREGRLKLESLEIVVTSWDKRGEVESVGSFGILEAALRVLEVRASLL